ncbi:MAG TPA: hypothetical protein DHW42_08350 [Candidatus Marinimicrobia bacterium]|nr:hypothetical protein [Candidatus Neomarinimicrobiota bacterium]
MSIEVINLINTSNKKCYCKTWLEHWEKFGEQKAGLCAEVSCQKKAIVGAHVQKSDSSDSSWYIIPLCKEHNNLFGQKISIKDSIKLVPANKQKTCAKKEVKYIIKTRKRFGH